MKKAPPKLSLPESVLVHACCAPCATVAAERLAGKCRVAFFFYGPNIHPAAEYWRRLEEMRRFAGILGLRLIEGPYEPAAWGMVVAPYRHLPEGSERCRACFLLRMQETARAARREGMQAFTVTLTVSRHKDSRLLARLGQQVAAQEGTVFLEMDFKKQDGYGLSVRLSRRYGLWRQDYCGCSLSRSEALRRRSGRRLA